MEMESSTKIKRPDYPAYIIKSDRLLSFTNWPSKMKQTGEQLSDAGFFYTQEDDWV